MYIIQLCFCVSVFIILWTSSVVSLELQCVPLKISYGLWWQNHMLTMEFLVSAQCGHDENGNVKVWSICSSPDDRNSICMPAIECNKINQNMKEQVTNIFPCHYPGKSDSLNCCFWASLKLSSVLRPKREQSNNHPHTHRFHHHNISKFRYKPEYPKGRFSEINTCMTPDNVKGVCTSLYSCPTMIEAVRQSSYSPRAKNYLKKFECSSNNESYGVCCVQTKIVIPTENKVESAETHLKHPSVNDNNCITPDNLKGVCTSLYSCPTMIEAVRQSSYSPIAKNYLKKFECSSNNESYGVCCVQTKIVIPTEKKVESADTHLKHPSVNDNNCITPDNLKGVCTSIYFCPTILEAVTQIESINSTEAKNYLTKLRCSDQPYEEVCCLQSNIVIPTEKKVESVETDLKHPSVNDNNCITPDNLKGVCTSIYFCPTILKAVTQIESINSTEARNYLTKLRCSDQLYDEVCCLQSNIIVPKQDNLIAELTTRQPEERQCGRQDGGGSWAVSLAYNTEKGRAYACGGAIISKRFILTAAYCLSTNFLRQMNLSQVEKVILEEYDTLKQTDCSFTNFGRICVDPADSFGIEKIITHERFNGSINDIGLVKVDRDILFSDLIQPICLPDKTFRYVENDVYFITGRGQTELESLMPKSTLRLIKRKNCTQLIMGQICLVNAEQGIDCSGYLGKLITKTTTIAGNTATYVIGILSHSINETCLKHAPSVATSVPFYLDWIKAKLDQN